MHVFHLTHLLRQKVVFLPGHLGLAAVDLLFSHRIHIQLVALSEVDDLRQRDMHIIHYDVMGAGREEGEAKGGGGGGG